MFRAPELGSNLARELYKVKFRYQKKVTQIKKECPCLKIIYLYKQTTEYSHLLNL